MLLSDELWLIKSVALLFYCKPSKEKLYIYKTYVLHKTSCPWGKNLGINGIEALTGDWEELNKETCVCNAYLQNKIKVCCCTQI